MILLVACRKDDGLPPPAPSPNEWRDFYGVEYRAPPGTNALNKNGVLPGPGGRGGVPADERPNVVLTKPQAFNVEIVKTTKPVSMEGMMYTLGQNKIGSNLNGKATTVGWDLTYETVRGDSTPSKTHIIYAALSGGFYQCTYDESTSPDPKAAEAICRSIRPKTPK